MGTLQVLFGLGTAFFATHLSAVCTSNVSFANQNSEVQEEDAGRVRNVQKIETGRETQRGKGRKEAEKR
jgi:hypothetical protein